MISILKKTTTLTQTASHFRCLPSTLRFLSSLDVAIVSDNVSTTIPINKVKNIRHTKKEKSTVQLTPLNVHLAVEKLREQAWAKFDESVELSVNLGVDPRKPNQSVKVISLFDFFDLLYCVN